MFDKWVRGGRRRNVAPSTAIKQCVLYRPVATTNRPVLLGRLINRLSMKHTLIDGYFYSLDYWTEIMVTVRGIKELCCSPGHTLAFSKDEEDASLDDYLWSLSE